MFCLSITINNQRKLVLFYFVSQQHIVTRSIQMKTAYVLPLFKNGVNYRPVSLLSCLSKLMERCIYKYVQLFYI